MPARLQCSSILAHALHSIHHYVLPVGMSTLPIQDQTASSLYMAPFACDFLDDWMYTQLLGGCFIVFIYGTYNTLDSVDDHSSLEHVLYKWYKCTRSSSTLLTQNSAWSEGGDRAI
jgi:hypothetical protein